MNEAARLTGLDRPAIAARVQDGTLPIEKIDGQRGIPLEKLRGLNGYQPPPPEKLAPVAEVFEEPWTLDPVLRRHLVSLDERDRAIRIAALAKQYSGFRDYLRDNPLPPVFRKPQRDPAGTTRATTPRPPDTPPPPPPRQAPPPPPPDRSAAAGWLMLGGIVFALFLFISQVPRILTGGPAQDISVIRKQDGFPVAAIAPATPPPAPAQPPLPATAPESITSPAWVKGQFQPPIPPCTPDFHSTYQPGNKTCVRQAWSNAPPPPSRPTQPVQRSRRPSDAQRHCTLVASSAYSATSVVNCGNPT